MKAEEFFATATDLLLSPKREADLRSCVSRAYYALYLMPGMELLKAIPLVLLQNHSLTHSKNHISHENLPKALRHSSNAAIRAFGGELESLRLARIDADYHLDRMVSRDWAADVYETAATLKSNVERFGISKMMKLIRADLEK